MSNRCIDGEAPTGSAPSDWRAAPVNAWLLRSLSRKYDAVLDEPLPPEFEALIKTLPDTN